MRIAFDELTLKAIIKRDFPFFRKVSSYFLFFVPRLKSDRLIVCSFTGSTQKLSSFTVSACCALTEYNIRQSPDDFQLEEGCGRNEEDENNAVWKNSLCACQIGHAAFTIVVPSQDGREPVEFPFRLKELRTFACFPMKRQVRGKR